MAQNDKLTNFHLNILKSRDTNDAANKTWSSGFVRSQDTSVPGLAERIRPECQEEVYKRCNSDKQWEEEANGQNKTLQF